MTDVPVHSGGVGPGSASSSPWNGGVELNVTVSFFVVVIFVGVRFFWLFLVLVRGFDFFFFNCVSYVVNRDFLY